MKKNIFKLFVCSTLLFALPVLASSLDALGFDFHDKDSSLDEKNKPVLVIKKDAKPLIEGKKDSESDACLNKSKEIDLLTETMNSNSKKIENTLNEINLSLKKIAVALEEKQKIKNKQQVKNVQKKIVQKKKNKDVKHLAPLLKFSLNEITINSLYSDQAWLKIKDSVYVLNVGDSIGDLYIKSINTKTGIVTTSKGVIKKVN